MSDKIGNSHNDPRFWEVMAVFAYFVGSFAILVYAFSERSFRTFGILLIVGSASWLVGTTLGFLFGVPRVRSGDPGVALGAYETSILPNTNLEQISDWLTKIIVGATLVQLGPIADGVGHRAVSVGKGLGSVEAVGAAAVSGGVIVFYFAAGFLWGYLWCSLRVFREMQSLVQRERQVSSNETAAVDGGS